MQQWVAFKSFLNGKVILGVNGEADGQKFEVKFDMHCRLFLPYIIGLRIYSVPLF
jgi:hypothetical protein